MFPSRSVSTRRLPACAGPIAGSAVALAAASVLAASAVLAADRESEAAFVPAPPPIPMAGYAGADLGQLLNNPTGLVIAGKRLNIGLLRRFYALHGFMPIWTSRQLQADALQNAVLRAGEHGLSPELFHAKLLGSAATLPPLYRDLLLSDAVLSYADALARGIMPVGRRRSDETLAPAPIDVAAVVDAAISSPNPVAAIEALAPSTPTYRLLRQALQHPDGSTPASGRTLTSRRRAIEVNLERERWLPRPLPADRVWVNAADEQLVLYRDNRPIFSTKVIVGQDEQRNQSPEFQAMISGILFNPPWNVPPDIVANEILPKTGRDPDYLARHNMVMLPDGGLQQLAGPNSALGQLMFEMNNPFDVYLHDTPSKNLFKRADRRISHGCIRVEDPHTLAALLMRQPIDAIRQAIATGGTTHNALPQPMPVFVVYETAFADADGRLQFRSDVYGRDDEVWTHVAPRQEAATAGGDAHSQRGG